MDSSAKSTPENIDVSFMVTPFEVNVTPQMIEDMNNVVDYC
jgi:hypothetical protein